jgi:peptidoglycan/xylan/chitin deacetylase (PgdA/CDA1 family)
MFRLDRFFTLYLFHPLVRLKVMNRSDGIPILMYHSISDNIEPNIHPYYQTTTSPAVFSKHMQFLYESGYSVLRLKDAVSLLNSRNNNYHKAVVLTFDDGFSDFYSQAFPILQIFRFTCTVFLTTAFVENQNHKFKGKNCLSWSEVKELHRYGISFGSHTVTHPKLTTLNVVDVQLELQKSKHDIESELHEDIESFCYPFAFPEENARFIKTLEELLQTAGYTVGVTTRIGIPRGGENPLFLKRIPVNEMDDLRLLKAKLTGAYDWVYGIQKFYKYLKRVARI